VGCYIWYSEEEPGRPGAPPSPFIAVPNVTAHPSTASVAITVLLYDGPLLGGFNVAIKGLTDAGAYENCRPARQDCAYADRPTRDNIDRRLRPAERHGSVLRTGVEVPVDTETRRRTVHPGKYTADCSLA